jgi:hypothetical protein
MFLAAGGGEEIHLHVIGRKWAQDKPLPNIRAIDGKSWRVLNGIHDVPLLNGFTRNKVCEPFAMVDGHDILSEKKQVVNKNLGQPGLTTDVDGDMI